MTEERIREMFRKYPDAWPLINNMQAMIDDLLKVSLLSLEVIQKLAACVRQAKPEGHEKVLYEINQESVKIMDILKKTSYSSLKLSKFIETTRDTNSKDNSGNAD